MQAGGIEDVRKDRAQNESDKSPRCEQARAALNFFRFFL
jgi:hypothetical protein